MKKGQIVLIILAAIASGLIYTLEGPEAELLPLIAHGFLWGIYGALYLTPKR